MMAISAASAAASAVEAKNMADRQSEAAQKAYDSDVMQTKNEMAQETQQASSQMSERARQAMVETGHLQALANESGTNGGGSNDRVTNEANFNAGQDMATMEANASSAQRQLVNQLNGSYSQAVSRDASIQQPSLIGTGLQIASGVGSAYTRGAAAKARAQGSVAADGSNQYGFAMPGSTS
ncbi:virion core protein, T7 gp14 family [Paraburkholderia sp. RL17-347-BIC-D]|uniref:virion core protein, T7 gp14 family n=1 Tax=Paraburkholderia sp. RL17-347-BIC-D TaxID=3031632 RepID=UPI0038B99FDF